MIWFRSFLIVAFFALPTAAQADSRAQSVTSPGGIPFWLIEAPANPVIALEFGFDGGTATDPNGQEGRANLVAATLDEGAGDRGAREFQQALQEQGIQLSFSARPDHLYGSLKTVTFHAEAAMDLLSDALAHPRFDAEAVTRIQAAIGSSIRRNTGDPGWLGRRAFYEGLWGDHPYAQPSRGTLASLNSLTPENLRTFTQERFALDQLHIAIVGDVTVESAGRLIDRAFGALPAEGVPYEVADIAVPAGAELTLVDWDGAQTSMMIVQEGLPQNHPQWEEWLVLNHILGGGGFASRLMQEVREARGLTYGISSFPTAFDGAALLMASTDVSNANVPEALATVRSVWAGLASEGPTDEEVADAKAFLIGSWPLRMTSTDSLARILLGLQINGRDPSYLEDRLALMEDVTAEEVRMLARTLLQPDDLKITLVGPGEGVTADRIIPSQELVERELAER